MPHSHSEEYPEKSGGIVCNGAETIAYRELSPSNKHFKDARVDHMLPKEPLFNEGLEPFETCAVVSNAGTLKGSGLGGEIDSNEFVIRFNSAPTKGYEEDVGSKTSVRILSPPILLNDMFGFYNENSEVYQVRV